MYAGLVSLNPPPSGGRNWGWPAELVQKKCQMFFAALLAIWQKEMLARYLHPSPKGGTS